MPFAVVLTDDAAHDLEDIADYVAGRDGPDRARHVLARIGEAVETLANFPERGGFPSELQELGIRRYREVFFKPYRIVYRAAEDSVYVLLIADGRRDMRALLLRRLLHADTPAT